MSFTGLLNKLVNIQRKTQGQDPLGQMIDSWAAVYKNVPCRANPSRSSSRELQLADDAAGVSMKFYFLGEQDILQGDRLIFVDDTDEKKTYEIMLVVRDSSGHHWECDARKVIYD